MAATIVGAPNIAAIPAVIPIIKPQEILPVKKPIPHEMIAKAAKALPPLPVTILRALQRVVTKALLLALPTETKLHPGMLLQSPGVVLRLHAVAFPEQVLVVVLKLHPPPEVPVVEPVQESWFCLRLSPQAVGFPEQPTVCAKEFEEIDIRNKNRRDKNIFFIAIKDWILEIFKNTNE